ncbi:Rho GTPase activation protein [Radiomyces spectabilis]|uniref:Rho GTPase activation protein n=1 Tax=Radiomyces spectabilis TaxID=64574 RepID=UPI00221FE8A5|nr:Rho GTPase activation protein [Radiomyces spectabilis]KAI8391699.1 Rho GTPase activation protein [Radiomyces spectabilis]
MPNFMNIGSSLRKELNEEFEGEDDDEEDDNDVTYCFQQIDLPGYPEVDVLGLSTPDLIVEESDTDDDDRSASVRIVQVNPSRPQERQNVSAYWSQPEKLDKVIQCQAIARTWLASREFHRVQQVHRSTFFQSRIQNIQAHVRGVLCRRELEQKRISYETCPEEWIIKLQSACRGFLVRSQVQTTMEHYKSNIDKVVKIQGFLKNRLMGHSYRKLTTESNPSVGTVKNFIHLLDDSHLDFDRELALEDLRGQVIQHIRENNQLDAHVNSVDIQIALLVRNAITIDEVLKASGAFKKKQQQRRFSQLASAANTSANPYSLNGVDKETRERRELYQQLVYLLQTEPKYLARLMSLTNGHDLGDTSSPKGIESAVLSLFGYATNSREEYLLINLCKYCIAEEMKFMESTQEFMRGNFMFMKLVVQTNRGAKERAFFRRLLTPLVSQVLDNDQLDLETDPVSIYHKAVNNEESRTGRPSARMHSANSQEALADREVRDIFILHLRNLREMTEHFLSAIITTVDEVPYGIRVVARELKLVLEENFPDEPSEHIIKILGNFIYYRYLNPAIVAPEQYDVIDSSINPTQRKNLAEISKMLQQISSGKVFDASDMFLAPLNDYVHDAGKRFAKWFLELTDVEDPETYFGMSSLADHASTSKPVVYISPQELYYLHYLIANNKEELEPEGRGMLTDIIQTIGPSPYRSNMELPESMLRLTLTNRADTIAQDPAARLQQLLVDTKRLVVYVIRIQQGSSLKAIFDAPVTQEHEDTWSAMKQAEFEPKENDAKAAMAAKRRYLKLGRDDSPLDIQSISFYQLKTIASRLVAHLERCKVITACNDYQDIISMIAQDITGKNSRRKQRDREIAKLSETLDHLQSKQRYLVEQRTQYEDYLNGCMSNMANKRGKKARFVFPFTRQYFHIRGLQKQGLVPKFGSYKYTAKQLHERGIVIEIVGINKKHYDRIPIILSMDQAGIITIEGSYSGWNMTSVCMDMRYEELLQTQYEGAQTMTLLDGMAKVNVNLLIYLINKK